MALHAEYWSFVVLLVSLVFVVLMITRWRFHPFIALILGAILVGMMAPDLPVPPGEERVVAAIELAMAEFGKMAGRIGWVIALAAIIGAAMMESGAAERIVSWLLSKLGEKQAAVALLICGYILSIPVFFDTVFFLLVPIGITLALKTGRDFVLYVLAMGGGAAITHTIVPPTPGPLIMAETLNIDLGVVIVAGFIAGIIPAVAVLVAARWMNRKRPLPVRVRSESGVVLQNPPSLGLSILPVVVPLFLISLVSVVAATGAEVPAWIAFAGNKNIAMGAGTVIAMILWSSTQHLDKKALWDAVGKPLEIAGTIILITAAGGAYGAMIQYSGIGDAIGAATRGFKIDYLVLGWMIAAVMKTAQGSGTVSMITTSAIILAMVGQDPSLGYHPVYLLLAIGFGSLCISWMNDSAFWVVARMSGFTSDEALRRWTLLLFIISVVGFAQVLVLARLLPMT